MSASEPCHLRSATLIYSHRQTRCCRQRSRGHACRPQETPTGRAVRLSSVHDAPELHLAEALECFVASDASAVVEHTKQCAPAPMLAVVHRRTVCATQAARRAWMQRCQGAEHLSILFTLQHL